jgi:hypothetical protein
MIVKEFQEITKTVSHEIASKPYMLRPAPHTAHADKVMLGRSAESCRCLGGELGCIKIHIESPNILCFVALRCTAHICESKE